MALTVSQHTHRAFLSPVALRSGLLTVQTSGRLRHEVWARMARRGPNRQHVRLRIALVSVREYTIRRTDAATERK